MGRLTVSQNERLLLHLLEMEKYRDEPQVPLALSQEGIAKRLSTQVHNASRALAALESEGLVSNRLAHVRGAPKRRRAYFLTDDGRSAAHKTRDEVFGREVVLERDGKAQRISIGEVVSQLTASGLSLSLLDLLEILGESEVIRFEDVKAKYAPQESARTFVQHAIGRPRVADFIGREKEGDELLANIGDESRHTVLIWGIPGIGKTYLGSHVYEELVGRANLFWYSIHSWDTAEHFSKILAEFLRSTGHRLFSEGLARGLSPGSTFAPLMKDLAASEAVIFLDDVQNASEEVEVALTVLVDASESSGKSKVVLMSRSVPSYFSKAVPGSYSVELKGLDSGSAWRLVEGVGIKDPAKAIRETHGHPLLLSLMAKSGIPESRGDIISYLDREVVSALAEDERTVMDLLSVYRHPVPPGALIGDSDRTLVSLRDKGFIAEHELGIETHDLLKDFFFSRMSPESRATLHARAAAYCETMEGSDWALERLHHWVEAKDWAQAVRASVETWEILAEDFGIETHRLMSQIPLEEQDSQKRAELEYIMGILSERVGDDESASGHYSIALELLGSSEGSGLRATVLESLGSLKTRVQEWAESLEAHQDALAIYEESDDRDGQMREWMNIGGVHRNKGDYKNAREAYTKALSLATQKEARPAQAACLNNVALLDWDEGRLRQAEMRMKESVRLAHAAKDHLGEAKGLENLAELMLAQNRSAEATNVFQESSEAYRRAGELAEYKRLQATAASTLGGQGMLEEGIGMCTRVMSRPELRRRKGLFHRVQLFDRGDIAVYFALIDLLRTNCDYEEAVAETRKLISIAESLDNASLQAMAKLELALTEEAAGDMEQAVSILAEVEDSLAQIGDKDGLVAVHMVRGRTEEKMGSREAAASHYREAARHAELTGNTTALAAARSALTLLGYDTIEEE